MTLRSPSKAREITADVEELSEKPTVPLALIIEGQQQQQLYNSQSNPIPIFNLTKFYSKHYPPIMLRASLARPIRGAVRASCAPAAAVTRRQPQSTIAAAGHLTRSSRIISGVQSRRSPVGGLHFQPARCYSAPAGLSKDEVQSRIMDLLRKFDKVRDPEKITPSSHFANDLGLDSLDTVEVVMAIEEVCAPCLENMGRRDKIH
ncbi:MAG: hypothetical protein M1816_008181 [Peltula sp. TS41687]|nr:MAG: hypothetical protein M1816_008181 [Peltula sp. TS41687]